MKKILSMTLVLLLIVFAIDNNVAYAAPVVSDAYISISGASGTGGAYIIGDTITASWDNTGTGDNNADVASVTVDFTAFGGGAAVAASNTGDVWSATYTIVSGAIDGTNLNVSVTATDSLAASTTTSDTTHATADNVAPTVSDGNLSISGASGTGGAYIIGDTVTATWNNTGGGDNNTDTISGVTVDFSAFGGGAAVVASNSSDTWTATYTIVAGAIDGTNLNVSATATDNAGNTTTTADTTNATADNIAPTVTDGNLSISGASGTGGAYIIGDTVTATWDNTGGGDNNTDTISGVTVDFSAFGGGAAVAASNSSDTWTATYTIVAGAIDGTSLNVSVTATDNAGNTTTTADTTNATADNIAPTVTDGNLSISGASGTGGAYIIGDTVTATWDNTGGGDNNTDTISGVTVDFSAFGGGAAVVASNSSDTWTATYTIVAGAIDGTNLNVSATATDNAGNATTTADTTNATADNVAPTVTDGNIAISGGSGLGGAYITGDTVTATWDNTGGGDNNTDTISGVTVDFSAFGGGAAVVATNSSDTWTATYTIVAGALDGTNLNVSVTATDNAGNTTTTADTTNATADNIAPTVTDGNLSISGASGTGGAYIIGDTITATWNNTGGGDNNTDTISGVTVDFSAFGGGAAVAASNSSDTWTATYTIVGGAIDSTSLNVSATATDNAGNATTTADTTNATADNIAPTVTDGNIAISGGSGTGGAYIIGDTVTATWDNTGGGDNNTDTISGVTVNFTAFGGGAAVAASNSSDTWTATYTIVAGAIDGTNLNVSVTATDNAGNTTTTADTTNATVDNDAPAVSSVSVPANATYIVGENLDFTVNFDENVTVSGGTPSLSITLNTGGTVSAAYVSGTGTSALLFRYTVQSGNVDGDGITVGGSITLSGATIADDAGNDTALTLNSVGSTAAVLVDGVEPVVTSVSVPAGSVYIAGENLDFTVNFDANVTIAGGTPSVPVTLNTGGTVSAAYVSGSGTGTLVFRYTVQAGDLDADGVAVGASIALNGATIKSGSGNDANLTLNSVASTASVQVDAVDPAVTTLNPADNSTNFNYAANLTITFNEIVAVGTGNVTIRLAADDSIVEAIDVTSGQVTGGGSTTITINPTAPLVPLTAYYVQIDATAFDDSVTNSYAGIGDTTTWNFTAAAGNNADLSAMTLSSSSLSPAFAASTTSYSASVANAISSMTVTPTLDDVTASVKVNNVAVVSGQPSGAISLNVGSNTITVVVTAADTVTTKTYTITVTRAAPTSTSTGSTYTPPTTTTVQNTSSSTVVVDGMTLSAGTMTTTEDASGETTTVLGINGAIIDHSLETGGVGTTISITIASDSDVVTGQLDGQMIADMASQEAVLEMTVGNVVYRVPATAMDVAGALADAGIDADLDDVEINISFETPSGNDINTFYQSATTGGYEVVAQPVSFEIVVTSGNNEVTISSFSSYVERDIEIPVGAFSDSDVLTGVIVNEDGSFSHVPTTMYYNQATGRYYARISSLSNSTYSVIYANKQFVDMAGHWSAAAVKDMSARMIVNGVDASHFAPDRDITRAEFAAIIVRALGLMNQEVSGNQFSDVKTTDWYYESVSIAFNYGIVTGFGDGSFRPNNKITRQEAMVMVSRAMDLTGRFNTALAKENSSYIIAAFNDSDAVAGWAKEGVAVCIDNDIIKGYNGMISGAAYTSRAETVTIIQRLLIQGGLI